MQDQLQSDSIRSANHHRGAERGIEDIRERKSEHKDTLRRQSGAELDQAKENAFQDFKTEFNSLGGAARDFKTKVVTKVKEISRKIQKTQSYGMSR